VPKVVGRDNEPFDILLKRFKKRCEKAVVIVAMLVSQISKIGVTL